MNDESDVSTTFDDMNRLIEVNELTDTDNSDVKHLQEELKRLQAELDECRSLVTVAECEKENVVESEQRKRKEEVASIQRIMEEAVTEAVRNASSRYDKEIAQLQKDKDKLEADLLELKSKEKIDITKEGVLAAVTKSLKRVGNLGSPLPFTSSTGESIENLEESMRKAQEDAEMLRSLVVPLEEEIKALKDKLRSTDEQLRLYETAFANLVKGLGSDSLSEMITGKGPAEVVEHLDEKVAFMPYRVNGQYIMEGLASSFLFTMGGLGFVVLDHTHNPNTPKLNRILLICVGFICILVSFATCWVFMRMKLPGYLQ